MQVQKSQYVFTPRAPHPGKPVSKSSPLQEKPLAPVDEFATSLPSDSTPKRLRPSTKEPTQPPTPIPLPPAKPPHPKIPDSAELHKAIQEGTLKELGSTLLAACLSGYEYPRGIIEVMLSDEKLIPPVADPLLKPLIQGDRFVSPWTRLGIANLGPRRTLEILGERESGKLDGMFTMAASVTAGDFKPERRDVAWVVSELENSENNLHAHSSTFTFLAAAGQKDPYFYEGFPTKSGSDFRDQYLERVIEKVDPKIERKFNPLKNSRLLKDYSTVLFSGPLGPARVQKLLTKLENAVTRAPEKVNILTNLLLTAPKDPKQTQDLDRLVGKKYDDNRSGGPTGEAYRWDRMKRKLDTLTSTDIIDNFETLVKESPRGQELILKKLLPENAAVQRHELLKYGGPSLGKLVIASARAGRLEAVTECLNQGTRVDSNEEKLLYSADGNMDPDRIRENVDLYRQIERSGLVHESELDIREKQQWAYFEGVKSIQAQTPQMNPDTILNGLSIQKVWSEDKSPTGVITSYRQKLALEAPMPRKAVLEP